LILFVVLYALDRVEGKNRHGKLCIYIKYYLFLTSIKFGLAKAITTIR
jgi:hypothetical protein